MRAAPTATAASMMAKKLLNHIEKEITAVYDRHSYDMEKREALKAWANQLMLIVFEAPVIRESST